MKAHLTKVSLALLFAALVLGCQDLGSGPVGPDGPQFDKRGDPGALCGGAGGPVRDENGHCHSDEEATGVPTYSISLDGVGDGAIFSVGGPEDVRGFTYETADPNGAVKVRDFKMDVTFFRGKLTCLLGGEVVDEPDFKTGTFSLSPFAIPHLFLFFEHNGAEQYISSLSDLPVPWPPRVIGDPVTVTDLNGEWEVISKGKNHRDACTGEGGPDSGNAIDWTATVTLLP